MSEFIKALSHTVRGIFGKVYYHASSARVGAVTGTIGILYPGLTMAQTDSGSGAKMGIGRMIEGASREIATGGTQGVKVFTALLGVAGVGYAAYALGWGRKNDERAHPIGQIALVGIGGILLLGLTGLAAIGSVSVFGADGAGAAESFNLDEIDTGADRGFDTGG